MASKVPKAQATGAQHCVDLWNDRRNAAANIQNGLPSVDGNRTTIKVAVGLDANGACLVTALMPGLAGASGAAVQYVQGTDAGGTYVWVGSNGVVGGTPGTVQIDPGQFNWNATADSTGVITLRGHARSTSPYARAGLSAPIAGQGVAWPNPNLASTLQPGHAPETFLIDGYLWQTVSWSDWGSQGALANGEESTTTCGLSCDPNGTGWRPVAIVASKPMSCDGKNYYSTLFSGGQTFDLYRQPDGQCSYSASAPGSAANAQRPTGSTSPSAGATSSPPTTTSAQSARPPQPYQALTGPPYLTDEPDEISMAFGSGSAWLPYQGHQIPIDANAIDTEEMTTCRGLQQFSKYGSKAGVSGLLFWGFVCTFPVSPSDHKYVVYLETLLQCAKSPCLAVGGTAPDGNNVTYYINFLSVKPGGSAAPAPQATPVRDSDVVMPLGGNSSAGYGAHPSDFTMGNYGRRSFVWTGWGTSTAVGRGEVANHGPGPAWVPETITLTNIGTCNGQRMYLTANGETVHQGSGPYDCVW